MTGFRTLLRSCYSKEWKEQNRLIGLIHRAKYFSCSMILKSTTVQGCVSTYNNRFHSVMLLRSAIVPASWPINRGKYTRATGHYRKTSMCRSTQNLIHVWVVRALRCTGSSAYDILAHDQRCRPVQIRTSKLYILHSYFCFLPIEISTRLSRYVNTNTEPKPAMMLKGFRNAADKLYS